MAPKNTSYTYATIKSAKTAFRKHELEKLYGARYIELLRFSYFDNIEYHVVDPMYNLLGTSKHMMKMWKERGILTDKKLEFIQEEVNRMEVPVNIGRILFKIESNFASFISDQWQNWTCVYTLYCLQELLPIEHYSCWVLFVEACCSFLQPSITLEGLENADKKLYEFCKANYGIPFERFNGVLGSFQKNRISSEVQM